MDHNKRVLVTFDLPRVICDVKCDQVVNQDISAILKMRARPMIGPVRFTQLNRSSASRHARGQMLVLIVGIGTLPCNPTPQKQVLIFSRQLQPSSMRPSEQS